MTLVCCNICGREFISLKSMTNHRRWHKIPKYKDFQESQKIREHVRNEKHFCWKGDDAGYHSLHYWVKRRKPKTELCEICGKVPPFDLINISDEYKRDINDYKWSCRKCHMEDDGRLNNRDLKGKFK